MTKEEFIKKIEATPIVQPDEWDLEMLAEIDAETDHSTVTFEQIIARRERRKKNVVRAKKFSMGFKKAK